MLVGIWVSGGLFVRFIAGGLTRRKKAVGVVTVW
jgi:hypothetical protein